MYYFFNFSTKKSYFCLHNTDYKMRGSKRKTRQNRNEALSWPTAETTPETSIQNSCLILARIESLTRRTHDCSLGHGHGPKAAPPCLHCRPNLWTIIKCEISNFRNVQWANKRANGQTARSNINSNRIESTTRTTTSNNCHGYFPDPDICANLFDCSATTCITTTTTMISALTTTLTTTCIGFSYCCSHWTVLKLPPLIASIPFDSIRFEYLHLARHFIICPMLQFVTPICSLDRWKDSTGAQCLSMAAG